MLKTDTLVSAGVAIFLIAILFLIAVIQNSVDDSRLLATPSIAKKDGILTSFARTKINASVDEVYSVLTNFKDYSSWNSHISEHKWENVTLGGAPMVGSKGTLKLSVHGFSPRVIPVKLTLFDKESKLLADRSANYPSWLFCQERVHEVVPVPGQRNICEYRTWQTIRGYGAYYLLLTAKTELSRTTIEIADELKTFVEKGGV